MKLCPACGTADSIAVHPVLSVKPVGSFSLAGAQTKFVASERFALRCAACGLEVLGQLHGAQVDAQGAFTGGHFVADPGLPAG